jgi:hypothetical protein
MGSKTQTQPVSYPGTGGTQPLETGGTGMRKSGGGRDQNSMLKTGRGLETARANGKPYSGGPVVK